MEVNVKDLLEVGAYFGHPSRQYDPRIKPFLFGKRQGIYIIDIEKTAEKIYQAADFLKKLSARGKTILFVGTKKQAQDIVKESGEKCGEPYVNYRWIGGTLTNFTMLRKRIARLDEIERLEQTGEINYYTKKEIGLIFKEKKDLLQKFGGIRSLTGFPAAMVIVDIRREMNAVLEAKKTGVPIVGVVDTNGNPELAEYPIPANDDGYKSIQLILTKLTEAILEVKLETQLQQKAEEPAAEEPAAVSDAQSGPEQSPEQNPEEKGKQEEKQDDGDSNPGTD